MAVKEAIAHLVVDNDQLVGNLTERDYARKLVLKRFSSQKFMVRDIMTTKMPDVAPANTVDECMALMTDKRYRHLPVMSKNLFIGDLVKATIGQQKFHITGAEAQRNENVR